MKHSKEQHLFIRQIFCSSLRHFCSLYRHFLLLESLLNQDINFFQKKMLNRSVRLENVQ